MVQEIKMTEEEAIAILESATEKEITSSARLVFLIYTLAGKEIPYGRDIPNQIKALSIETVQAIRRLK